MAGPWLRVADAFKAPVGTPLTVKGWVRTRRDSKADGGLSFIAVHDGTCFDPIQVVARADLGNYAEIAKLTSGCSVEVEGELVASQGKGQAVEVAAKAVRVVGLVDNPDEYPVAQKRHTFEYLRDVAHLRARTNTFGAVARVRHSLSMAVHRFFHERGYYWVHTPIITGSDAEGAGQMFRVSTLDLVNLPRKGRDGETERRRDEEKKHGDKLEVARATAGGAGAAQKSGVTAEQMGHAIGHSAVVHSGRQGAGEVDWSEDFFGKETHLTVSGQLNVETYCCALSRVYTFGPTFRAENSNTPRHLAEFWMIEPEIAFCDLMQDSRIAEEFVKYVIDALLAERPDDMKFFEERIEQGLMTRLRHVLDTPFTRVSYTEAIHILQKSGKAFEFPVSWGADIQTEHERYLTEEHFKGPVIVMNYPKAIKAFYMRDNDGDPAEGSVPESVYGNTPKEKRLTVAAMDVLVPRTGELIGGSQREERLDYLDRRIDEMGLRRQDYWWYRDLRRYGTVPHAGFGLGFERLILFATGMQNIRDVIPFPRAPKQAEF